MIKHHYIYIYTYIDIHVCVCMCTQGDHQCTSVGQNNASSVIQNIQYLFISHWSGIIQFPCLLTWEVCYSISCSHCVFVVMTELPPAEFCQTCSSCCALKRWYNPTDHHVKGSNTKCYLNGQFVVQDFYLLNLTDQKDFFFC